MVPYVSKFTQNHRIARDMCKNSVHISWFRTSLNSDKIIELLETCVQIVFTDRGSVRL